MKTYSPDNRWNFGILDMKKKFNQGKDITEVKLEYDTIPFDVYLLGSDPFEESKWANKHNKILDLFKEKIQISFLYANYLLFTSHKYRAYVPLRSKKAGRFDKLLGFARCHLM